jgi:hypothetical protein
MTHTITLRGDYGYSAYRASGLDRGTTIDATAAEWTVANSRNTNPVEGYGADTGDLPINRYPFNVVNAPGVIIKGGTINGEVPQSSDWTWTYRDDYPDGTSANSAAVRVENSPGAIIDDWHITKPWDGIRVTGSSNGFLIDDAWVSDARDDAVENDAMVSGTIRDSLFDGVMSGISLDSDVDGSGNTVTFDGMLLRNKPYLYKGDIVHASPIKTDSAAPEHTPHLRFIDSVIAIEDPNHNGQHRLQAAWDHTVESHGNVFLNLSDTPLGKDYPKPGAGWTILQGEAARDYWEAARAEWIKNHQGTDADTSHDSPTGGDPLPPAEQPPLVEQPTGSGPTFTGTSGNDRIIANDLDNNIIAKRGDDVVQAGAGNDTINAGNGADVIWLGAGDDTIVFGRGGDMDNSLKAVDIYKDFEHGADKFDLALIDANETQPGDQAFAYVGNAAFAANKPGQLRTSYDAAHDLTRVELNTDADAKVEYHYTVQGKHVFTALDFVV